jgi:hypothetical protein
MEDNSQAFTNNFGHYYETYIQEVLKYYLKRHQFRAVDKRDGKKSDWLIESEKYVLVVEQKSSLITISLKAEYPSLEILDEYLIKNFKEAYLQLTETVKSLKDSKKIPIKLILHFEKYFMGEAIIKDRVNKILRGEDIDFSRNFFIETEEFERLIQVLSEDEASFNKVVETKLKYEIEKPPASEGIEFSYVMNKFGISHKIKFLESHKNYFDTLFPK